MVIQLTGTSNLAINPEPIFSAPTPTITSTSLELIGTSNLVLESHNITQVVKEVMVMYEDNLLIIRDLSGNTEGLTDYKDLSINTEVNGDYSISFTSILTETNKHSYHLIAEESIVEYEGHEYRIKQLNTSLHHKTIKAPHVFFDLIDSRKYEFISEVKSAEEIFTWLLEGTGWTFQVIDTFPDVDLAEFGDDNVLSLIWQVCSLLECEVEINTGRHLKIYAEMGSDNDYQFRYKHNIKTLSKQVDTSNLATVIKGFGGDGLEVTYESPNKAIFGERHTDPIKDEKIINVDTMNLRLKNELKDTPDVSIEISEVDFGEIKEIGDKVWLIYEPLNIEFQARIIARKKFPQNKAKNSVTLGTRKKKMLDLLTDTKVEIKENQKETRSSVASLQVEADNITLSVKSLDDRVGTAESELIVQADQISSKVSSTDYNGDTIASLINQTATSVLIQANNIDLNGITTVAESLSLGSPTSTGRKTLKFKDDTYIETNGDGLAFDSMGIITFRTPVHFNGSVTGVTARFG